MHDRKITMFVAAFLAICTMGVMGCTIVILFSGNLVELAMGVLATMASVYAFLDVSKDL